MVAKPILQAAALTIKIGQVTCGHSLFFQGFEQLRSGSSQSLHLTRELTLVFRRARFVLVGGLEFLCQLGKFILGEFPKLTYHITAGNLLSAVEAAGRHHGLDILTFVGLCVSEPLTQITFGKIAESLVEESFGQLVFLFPSGIVKVGKGFERQFPRCLTNVNEQLGVILHALEMICHNDWHIEFCQQVIEIPRQFGIENRSIGALNGFCTTAFLLEKCHMLGKQVRILPVNAVLVEQTEKAFVEKFVLLSPNCWRYLRQRFSLTYLVEHIFLAPE